MGGPARGLVAALLLVALALYPAAPQAGAAESDAVRAFEVVPFDGSTVPIELEEGSYAWTVYPGTGLTNEEMDRYELTLYDQAGNKVRAPTSLRPGMVNVNVPETGRYHIETEAHGTLMFLRNLPMRSVGGKGLVEETFTGTTGHMLDTGSPEKVRIEATSSEPVEMAVYFTDYELQREVGPGEELTCICVNTVPATSDSSFPGDLYVVFRSEGSQAVDLRVTWSAAEGEDVLATPLPWQAAFLALVGAAVVWARQERRDAPSARHR